MAQTSPSTVRVIGCSGVCFLMWALLIAWGTETVAAQQQVINGISGARLIYATETNVYALSSLKDPVPEKLTRDDGGPMGVSCDTRTNATYWSNAERLKGVILTSSNGSIASVVDTGLLLPEKIAYDWITQNIYIVDIMEDHLVVCGISTNLCSILLKLNALPLISLTTLVLYPNKGIMFWAQRYKQQPEIMAAGMDGSLPHAIVSTDLGRPVGICIDMGHDNNGTEKMYWVDTQLDRIESSNLDGTNRKTISSKEYSKANWIGVLGDQLFWADENSIRSLNKLTGVDRKMRFQLPGKSELIHVVEICHKGNQPIQRSNPCAKSGCSHICTLSPMVGFRCFCPMGMLLDDDKRTCIESSTAFKLFMSDKNKVRYLRFGSIGRDVLESITFPELRSINALAYNPINQTLIMSDGILNKIYQYNLIEKQLEVLVYRIEHRVMAMDIDLVGGNLYWVDTSSSSIQVMSLRTKARSFIKTFPLIAIDILVVNELSSLFVSHECTRGRGILITKVSLKRKDPQFRITKRNFLSMEPIGLTYNKTNTTDIGILSWVDKLSGIIESAFTNGTLLTAGIRNSSGLHNTTISDAVFYGDKIYWRDECSPELKVTSLDDSVDQLWSNSTCSFGTNAKMAIFNKNMADLSELLDNHECSWRNPNKKQCSHICLITGVGNKGECHCPEGLGLNENGLTCDEDPDRPASCLSTQFECRDGSCIRMSFLCDGSPDCYEEEDEDENRCSKYKWEDGVVGADKEPRNYGTCEVIIGCIVLVALLSCGGYWFFNRRWRLRQNAHSNPYYDGNAFPRETLNL